MERGATNPPPATDRSSPKPKFSVYQNPAISAALTAQSRRPSPYELFLLFSWSLASCVSLFYLHSRGEDLVKIIIRLRISSSTSEFLVKSLKTVIVLVFVTFLSTLVRALSLRNTNNALRIAAAGLSSHKAKEHQTALTSRQSLLGLNTIPSESVSNIESNKKPPKSRSILASESLGPISRSTFSYTPYRESRIASDQLYSSSGKKATLSPMSPPSSQSQHVSPVSPWSRRSAGRAKGIQSEAMLEQYLAQVGEMYTEPTPVEATPSPPLRGFVIASPSSVTSQSTSGAARSTALRPARMSPGSHQKYSTSPKKREGDLPPPFSMEQMVEAFESLGIYPQIEVWRDHLRQWFSSMLINPLYRKIQTNHIQVAQTAASVGITITVSQIGIDSLNGSAPVNLSPITGTTEWLPTVTVDEDGLLHQLRASLLQARDGSISQTQFARMQQPQANSILPFIQACIDAITDHQRLKKLMKGELIKGLLPQSSVRAEYTVKRVRELAEGTCLKNYDYMGNGCANDKGDKKWNNELPTDSHLLLYLFCAFLEHPQWMLHVDPTSYSSAQYSKNPLFLGLLPPADRFPEKYVAVISGVPSVLHPGACILAIGKQSPLTFALYWDKKLQFSLQGRTALWDSILLLCHRIETSYGGVVRGVHLGSSALNILPVFNTDTEN
ncbi:uncharacterized protein LOC122056652 [Zingiber officinale]|uniref:uncharacterized protein LOC122056652 n=1 Tax=Zingiber officinale TaxID=94328 RepID=UPI001C4DC6D1|nr:uncharacterized protein LOC122056652 [Zingiber officinale]